MNTLQPSASERWQPPKMSWWYDAIIDLMTARPDLNKKEIAEHFRVTPQAIYLITNSDIFKARFEQRRAALSTQLDGSIHQKLLAVADRSLGLIAEVLDKKRDQIPLPQLESLADKVLDRLGYGQKPQVTTSPSVVVLNDNRSVVVPVSPSDLDAARAALRRAEVAQVASHQPALAGARSTSLGVEAGARHLTSEVTSEVTSEDSNIIDVEVAGLHVEGAEEVETAAFGTSGEA